MTNRAAGLSVQEAFAEAQAEIALEEANSQTPSSVEPETIQPSDVEQSAVETEEENSLFSVLESDNGEGEQSDKELHDVTVNGETFKVTLSELINGYQRQADYTQGRQEIANERKEHQKAITLWEALEADYAGTVQKLMSRAGGVPIKGRQSEPQVDIESLVEQKLQEKLSTDPRIQAFEQEQSLRQIETIFGQIEQEFNIQLATSDKQVILERAQQQGTTDLRYVVWQLLQQREQHLTKQRNVELASTTIGRRSGTEDDITPNVEYFSTPGAAWAAALAEEGNLS